MSIHYTICAFFFLHSINCPRRRWPSRPRAPRRRRKRRRVLGRRGRRYPRPGDTLYARRWCYHRRHRPAGFPRQHGQV